MDVSTWKEMLCEHLSLTPLRGFAPFDRIAPFQVSKRTLLDVTIAPFITLVEIPEKTLEWLRALRMLYRQRRGAAIIEVNTLIVFLGMLFDSRYNPLFPNGATGSARVLLPGQEQFADSNAAWLRHGLDYEVTVGSDFTNDYTFNDISVVMDEGYRCPLRSFDFMGTRVLGVEPLSNYFVRRPTPRTNVDPNIVNGPPTTFRRHIVPDDVLGHGTIEEQDELHLSRPGVATDFCACLPWVPVDLSTPTTRVEEGRFYRKFICLNLDGTVAIRELRVLLPGTNMDHHDGDTVYLVEPHYDQRQWNITAFFVIWDFIGYGRHSAIDPQHGPVWEGLSNALTSSGPREPSYLLMHRTTFNDAGEEVLNSYEDYINQAVDGFGNYGFGWTGRDNTLFGVLMTFSEFKENMRIFGCALRGIQAATPDRVRQALRQFGFYGVEPTPTHDIAYHYSVTFPSESTYNVDEEDDEEDQRCRLPSGEMVYPEVDWNMITIRGKDTLLQQARLEDVPNKLLEMHAFSGMMKKFMAIRPAAIPFNQATNEEFNDVVIIDMEDDYDFKPRDAKRAYSSITDVVYIDSDSDSDEDLSPSKKKPKM
jgi:hypothetical protein